MQANQLTSLNELPTSLTNLDLSYNSIDNIDRLPELLNLEYLNLKYNKIAKFPSLKNFFRLEVLDLSNNQISTISQADLPTPVPVDNLKSELRELYLSNNAIATIPDNTFLHQIEMNYLILNGKSLKLLFSGKCKF